MNPPIVYDVISPNAHSTSRTVKIVQSIRLSFSRSVLQASTQYNSRELNFLRAPPMPAS